MRSPLLIAIALLLASPAFAAPKKCSGCGVYERDRSSLSTYRSAVGFHNVSAPIGARIALGRGYGLDLGVGFSSSDDTDTWSFDGGVPITVKSWPDIRSRVLFRPGVLLENCNSKWGDTRTTTVSAELEGEAFIVRSFSVSAAFGLAYETVDPPGSGGDETRWTSTGGEFTRVGMHLYLFR